MRLKVWGTRGSIPISGEEYIQYGGETSCYEIETSSGETIILDGGTGLRKLGQDLLKRKIENIHLIFSHFHWDHIMGFPFFTQIYIPTSTINIYGVFNVDITIEQMFGKAMTAPNFPQEFQKLPSNIIINKSIVDKKIGDVFFDVISLNHPNCGQGIKLIEKGKTIIYLTDNELGFEYEYGSSREEFIKFCTDCDVLMHDSEFTKEDYKIKRGWGHSYYIDSLELAIESRVKKFILIHHNQDRKDKEIDAIVEDCRRVAKNKKSSIIIEAAYEGMEFEI